MVFLQHSAKTGGHYRCVGLKLWCVCFSVSRDVVIMTLVLENIQNYKHMEQLDMMQMLQIYLIMNLV